MDHFELVDERALWFVGVVPDGTGISENGDDTGVVEGTFVGDIQASDSVAKARETRYDGLSSIAHGFNMELESEFLVKEDSEPSDKPYGGRVKGVLFVVEGELEGRCGVGVDGVSPTEMHEVGLGRVYA